MILIFVLATACSPKGEETLDTNSTDTSTDGSDTSLTTEDTASSEETDTAPPPVLLSQGSWSLSSPQILSDVCSLNSYQDVTESVPTTIVVTQSSEAGFTVDSETQCTRSDLVFTCSSQETTESALAGTAEMIITSVMSGVIINEDEMDTIFDVTIESCEGAGCIAIEAALTLPCPVTLESRATAE